MADEVRAEAPAAAEQVPVTPGENAPAGQAPVAGNVQPAGDAPAAGDAQPADPDDGLRVARRRFFRAFAADALHLAATVVGAAGALRDASAEAAGTLMSTSAEAAPAGPPGTDGPAPAPEATQPGAGFRSPFRLEGDQLILLDQRRLPDEMVEVPCRTGADVSQAIRDLAVRGAPAIGQVAAIGLALSAGRAKANMPWARRAIVRGTANALRNARPTAASVAWAVDRMMARFEAVDGDPPDGEAIARAMREEAEAIVAEATADHARMADLGLALLPAVADRPIAILTHCNTGPLACGQIGTALGVVQVAHAEGRQLHVYVSETRPWLQGARLTAWELSQAGVPFTLLADAAAGWLLASGRVDVVLVGADRIAANGDTANKIGTYPLAVLAARHGIPFYVVSPTASIDLATADGDAIPIELRPASEIVSLRGRRIAPEGTEAWNPVFDVTPAELIAAIVTEGGVLRPPFPEAIAAAVAAARARRPLAVKVAPEPSADAAPGTADAAEGTASP